MFKQYSTLIFLLASCSTFAQTQTFHYYNERTIDGASLSMSSFYGKKVMVVNVASYCSWTYQYEALQALYDQYKDSNFTIIGFPCNNFNSQEPGSDSSILDFCTDVYGITFQLMAKVGVISTDTAEVYKWLQREDLNGVSDAHVVWNFNKFLIDEAGHWVAHYTNLTEPDDQAIIDWILSPSVLPADTTDTTTAIQDVRAIQMLQSNIVSGSLEVSFENLNGPKTNIQLISPSGQFISTLHDAILRDEEIIRVNVATLPNGIYFLLVKNQTATGTFRFAVMN